MEKPNWYYKTVVIPELLNIQRELQIALPRLVDPDEELTFFYTDKDAIASVSPSYVKMLERMGLYERWAFSAIVTTSGNKEFPIHVDCVDWIHRCYGLNLPIVNCDDSDTVWYDADIINDVVLDESDRRNPVRFCNAETAKEVCRMPATTTAWINTSIPHRPESRNSALRAIISARFRPEVHDCI